MKSLLQMKDGLENNCNRGRRIMNKIKIIALFGPAGPGKDYLLHEIMDDRW